MSEGTAIMTPPAGRPVVSRARSPRDRAAVRAVRLTRRFGAELAVCDLTFEVAPGTIFGFIGPSGSGKTTTIRMLTGSLSPTAGDARVLGEDPVSFSARTRSRIGYMPQIPVLYPNLSLWENLNFAASLYGMPLRRHRALEAVLELVELGEHRRKRLDQVSGGMQRRLSLAATLVHEPELLFLDEPTTSVDPVLRRRLWDHLRRLRQAGRTLFVTTQYVGEAEHCDLVGLIAGGEMVALDTPGGLRRAAYGGDIVEVQVPALDYGLAGRLQDLGFIRRVSAPGGGLLRLVVDEASTDVPKLVDWFRDQQAPFESIEERLPSFDDVFLELVENRPAPQDSPLGGLGA